jgi:type IV fimbrial biogenesis protein FimT
MLTSPPTRASRSSRSTRIRSRGVTLIELAIVFVIVGILMAMGLPAMADILRDNRVRSIAESFSDGLGRARIEAIQRNTTVNFAVDGRAWRIELPDPGGGDAATLRSATPATSDAALTVGAAQSTLAFDGSGRASLAGFAIDFGHSSGSCEADGGSIRCLRVVVSARGAIRTCDPALGGTDPRACN